jgi:SAM-dependent methyltransferase
MLVSMRLLRDFWGDWVRVDATIEELFLQQHPEAARRITWSDPGSRLLAVGWLLEELSRNAEYLFVLGREDDAARVMAAAEKLATAAASRNDPLDVLLANAMSRLLLAGWRDAPDPLSEMEAEVDKAVFNVGALRAALRFGKRLPRPFPFPPRGVRLLLGTALSGRQALSFHGMGLGELLGFQRLAGTFFAAGSPPLPLLGRAMAGLHSVAADEAAFAFNLPFALVPVGAELEGFLAGLAIAVPGDAVLLGGGDGGEALRVARVSGLNTVYSVDHSALAWERLGRALSRLHFLGETTRVRPVRADVRDVDFPEASVSLVIASHLLEYLEPPDRQALYRRIRQWLKPGGKVFLLVHAAEGERVAELLSQFSNASGTEEPGGIRLTISSLVPARPDAGEVKHFLSPDALRNELAAVFDDPTRFLADIRVVPAPGGFVEIVVIVSLAGR